MASFAPKGHAQVDPRRPAAFAICDRCGFMYNHDRLVWDTQFHGRNIKRTGYLVCASCNDIPNPTLRPIVLPPDPVPIRDPRPEPVHCHVFKPRADSLRPSHPTADTSNRMFPPVDMWKDVTVDTGETCDARTYKDGFSVPVPKPPIPVIPPIEPPDATTDNTSATSDTTGTTVDASPVMDPVLIALNTADTTGVEADDSDKLVNVFPDYLYAADMTTEKTDDSVLPTADSQTD